MRRSRPDWLTAATAALVDDEGRLLDLTDTGEQLLNAFAVRSGLRAPFVTESDTPRRRRSEDR